MYESNETDPKLLPDPGDVMIVEKDLAIFVYGVPGFPLGKIVDSISEAEAFVVENFDDGELVETDVWYFVETTEPAQRDFWKFESDPVDDAVDYDPTDWRI